MKRKVDLSLVLFALLNTNRLRYFSRLETHAYDVERDHTGDDDQLDPARNRDPDRKSKKQDADERVAHKIAPVGQVDFKASPDLAHAARLTDRGKME